jgi:hypothetical protein
MVCAEHSSYCRVVIQNPNNGNKLYETTETTEEALTHLTKACMNQLQETSASEFAGKGLLVFFRNI